MRIRQSKPGITPCVKTSSNMCFGAKFRHISRNQTSTNSSTTDARVLELGFIARGIDSLTRVILGQVPRIHLI